MRIYFLKEYALETLKANVEHNIDNYFEFEDGWVENYLDDENAFQEYKYLIKAIELDMSKEIPEDTDIHNIKAIYEGLDMITPSQATDERLWAGLSHKTFSSFVEYRWGDDIKNSSNKKNAILNRYFINGGKRGLYLNAISRMWWMGYFYIDEKLDNPYKYLEMDYLKSGLMSKTFAFQSRVLTNNKKIFHGILDGIIYYEEKEIYAKRSEINKLLIRLNLLGGTYSLDYFTKEEIKDKTIEILEDILTTP